MVELNPIKYTKAITVCSFNGDPGSLVCALLHRIFGECLDLSLPLVLQNLFEKFLVIHKDRARMCSFVSIRERRMKMKSMQKNFPAIVALIYFLFASLAIQKPNCFSHECPSWLAQKMDFSKHPF